MKKNQRIEIKKRIIDKHTAISKTKENYEKY